MQRLTATRGGKCCTSRCPDWNSSFLSALAGSGENVCTKKRQLLLLFHEQR